MKRTSLTLSLLLILFAGGVVSQVPDEVHEKCKDARDYVGCIQVLTGTAVNKEEAEIEEIKNLKKTLALLPSRLQNTSLRDFSMAIQPFTYALAAAEAAAIGGSDYSIEDKTKILELTNTSLRLSAAIDIFRSTWDRGIELEDENKQLELSCSMFDSTINRFNQLMESNVLDHPHFMIRILLEESCRTRSYRGLEGQMLFYIIDAIENILTKGKFPNYSKPYKDLNALKTDWYEANTYDLSEYKSRASEYSNKYMRNKDDKPLTLKPTARTNRGITKIYILEKPSMDQIKKMDGLLIKFQKRGYMRAEFYNCTIDTQNRMYITRLAKFYFDTKEGSRESNLRKVEELSLNLLASDWEPHLLSYESCTQKTLYSRSKYLFPLTSDFLKDMPNIYEQNLGYVKQSQELLEKVEKERALNSVR